MSSNQSNNKRIAKNTILLYIRMLVTMAISLFTSRVILQKLGVEDFGIYNVVGGVIAMFSFINDAMTTSSQRYITFALGKGNASCLRDVFSTSFQIHILIALLILVVGETLGLWFLMNKLVIPEPRMAAAIVVYQCTVLSAILGILMVPYIADIVAHERMSAFAYISIVEVISKLLIVYMLVWSPCDRLVTYSVLLIVVQVMLNAIYFIYCRQNFSESSLKFIFDRSLLKEMSGFAGWSFFGSFAIILYSQGLNMMLNIFFGPLVNAARGIALQVQGAIQKLVGSFQMALNPQITKNYASGQLEAMFLLMCRSARFSFFLMYTIGLVIILECEQILQLWLGEVPENTTIFCQLMIMTALLYTIVNPCAVANQATGKVKKYQIAVGGILLTILPISYVLLRIGLPAYTVFIVHLCMEACAQIARMFILKQNMNFSISSFCKNVYWPIVLVVLVTAPLPCITHCILETGIVRMCAVLGVAICSVCIAVFFVGITPLERSAIVQYTRRKKFC